MTGTIILPIWLVAAAGTLLIVISAVAAIAIVAWYRAAAEIEARQRAAVAQILAPAAGSEARLRAFGRAAGEVFGG